MSRFATFFVALFVGCAIVFAGFLMFYAGMDDLIEAIALSVIVSGVGCLIAIVVGSMFFSDNEFEEITNK